MTALTLPTLVVVAVAFWRPSLWPVCLAVAGGTPAGAALIARDFALPTVYFAALLSVLALTLSWAGLTAAPTLRFHGIPGAGAFLALIVWAGIVTLTAPALFPGLVVVGPAPYLFRPLAPGALTPSNVAQYVYLAVGLAIMLLVASTGRSHAYLVGVPLFVILGLSLWKYSSQLAPVPFPVGFFDNNPTWTYIETAPGGAPRFRGILPEPAAFATCCLPAAAFAVAMIPRAGRWARVVLCGLAGAAVWLGILSTSATFLVAGSILLVVATARTVIQLLVRSVEFTMHRLLAALVFCGACWTWGAQLVGFVSDRVAAKSGSSSYDDRSGVDSYSMTVFAKSWGLGTGVGSNRPSSFVVALLSCVGIVGTALFIVMIARIVQATWHLPEAGPTLWVLLAVLVTKCLSGPDLGDTSGVFYLALGVLAGMGARRACVEAAAAPPSISFPARAAHA